MARPDHRMVATVATHDTPTFAAFAAGDDLEARRVAGLLDAEHAGQELAGRQRAVDGLVAALEQRRLPRPAG